MKKVLSALLFASVFAIIGVGCSKDKDKDSDPTSGLYGTWEFTHWGIYNYDTHEKIAEYAVEDWEILDFKVDGSAIEYYEGEVYNFTWKVESKPNIIALWGDEYKFVKLSDNSILLLATPESVDNYYNNPKHVWGYKLSTSQPK